MSTAPKPNLEPTESRLQTAWVIERTNSIEFTLKGMLCAYVKAERQKFFNNIILNSSMLIFASKVKALRHIVLTEGLPKFDWNHFHTVMNVRNAFAHCDTNHQHVTVILDETDEATVADVYMTLDSVESSGKFQQVRREEALAKFTESYAVVKDYLMELSRLEIFGGKPNTDD